MLKKFFNFLDSHSLQILGVILLLAIVASISLNLESPPSMQLGENDTWWAIALNLIHGQGYSLCLVKYFPFCNASNQVTATREPIPVLLFAAVAFISNESLYAASAVELIIYLAVLVAIFFLTRQWANTRSALLAALFWAIYMPAIELIPQVSGDLLGALCVTVGIFLVFRAKQSNRMRDWLMAAISLGLAVLSRSGTLVIVCVVIAGQIIDSWLKLRRIKDAIQPALIISGVVVVMMTPWIVRTDISLGRPIIGSSLIGYNMYRHNYMIETGNYFRYVGGEEGLQAIKALIARRSDLRGTENEAQMDQVYREEALKIIRAYPDRYLALSAYRFLPLWFNWGFFQAYGKPIPHEDKMIMVFQAIILLLAIWGMCITFARSWPLWGSVALVSLAYMAVDSQLLYLTPVMPLVLSLSAVGAMALLEKFS